MSSYDHPYRSGPYGGCRDCGAGNLADHTEAIEDRRLEREGDDEAERKMAEGYNGE